MNLKKGIALMLAAVMVLFVLAACTAKQEPQNAAADQAAAASQGQSEKEDAQAPAAQTDVTITCSRWAGPNADAQKEIVKNYTNGTIVIDDVDYSNLKEKQILSLSASAEYDLVWVPEIWLPEYVENGWLLPLDDFVANDPTVDLDDYLSGIVEIGKVDGTLYAMPDLMQGMMMTYNTEWFAQEGQEIPTTWEELIAVAKHFKEAGTGIGLPIQQGQAALDLFAMILYSNDGDYFDADGNLALTSDAVLEAAQMYAELCQYAMPGSTTWHIDQVSEAVRTGKCPFGISSSGLAAQDADPESSVIADHVAYGAMPGAKKIAGCLNTWSWAIAANSANPEAAWEAVKYLVSADTEKQMALQAGHTSAVKALAEDPEVLDAEPFLAALSEQMANGRTQPLDPEAAALTDPMIAALSEIATTGADPVEVMTNLQNTLGDSIKLN